MNQESQIDWLEQLRWMDMTEGQRSVYMEFYSPILENNIKRMPENEELISCEYFTPIQGHIDAFTTISWHGTLNEGDESLTDEQRYIRDSFTDGQRDAIILWLYEVEGNEEVGEIDGW